MKIAIYGGAFNPVHNEHVNIVNAAIDALGLDKVIVVPTNVSPHKGGELSVRGRDRLGMCRLAFTDKRTEISDCEIKRGGISYSYVTCRRFRKLYPNDELYFIIGGDMLSSFRYWKEPEEILKCVTLAVCARENAKDISSSVRSFSSYFKKSVVDFGYVGKDVSSTKVRALAALGEDISDYVPEPTAKYILSKGLYLLPEARGVKKYLTAERWRHTVRVAVCAASHARLAGVYEYDALMAAALHDCAKYLGSDAAELKGFAFPENVPSPVMHQYTGAYVAEHTFGIKDKNVLNAVRYHTSGRENMSPLEKLIFLSDMLEEGRDFEGVDELRKLFEKDLDVCLLAALEHQIAYLKGNSKPIYPLTERAYRYLKEQKY